MSNIANTEIALKTLFNCGTLDLSIIDDTNADVTDYIQNSDTISLGGFVSYIVANANEILKNEWKSRKHDVMAEIEDMKKAAIEECGDDYDFYDSDEPEDQIIVFFENDADEIIEKGLSLYFNYLDTHIYLRNADFFDRFGILDSVNNYIGFTEVSVCNA